MATPIIMPRQGLSVESCIITGWHKNKGDTVETGEILFTYETDKATFEEEAPEAGILLDVFFEEGDDVPVLTNVCVIGEEGEDISEYSPYKGEEDSEAEEAEGKDEEPSVEPVPEEGKSYEEIQPSDHENDIIKISPRARNLAEKGRVDFSQARATGPGDRIIERDIMELLSSRDAQPTGDVETSLALEEDKGIEVPMRADYQEVELTNIRKVIAKTMHNSLANTAQLTLNSSFDATDILDYRSKLKAKGEKQELNRITINDIILYAVSRTLLDHKDLNAHLIDDTMRIFSHVHLGVAIDTPRGLMVPTIFNSDEKSLYEISQEVKDLAESSQEGIINPDLLQGGTFTVTNLGTLGIEAFTPVLNPPQTGILGVNNITQRVREVDGDIEYYPAMGLSLTFDHRAIDGAPAARFLKDLRENLEDFSLLLAR